MNILINKLLYNNNLYKMNSEKILTKNEIVNIINNYILDYYLVNKNLFCPNSFKVGLKCCVSKNELNNYLLFFNGLFDNNKIEKDNIYEIFDIQFKSYILGILVGCNYNGLYNNNLNSINYVNLFYYDLLNLFKDDNLNNCCSFSNCNNGYCLRILDVVPILKKILPFKYNFKFGCDYDCCEENNKLKVCDFNKDDYDRIFYNKNCINTLCNLYI